MKVSFQNVILVCVVALSTACVGCAGAAAALGGAGQAAGASRPGYGVSGLKLMLFGGQGHKTYLGCLNCSQYAADSVKNAYGAHGSAYSQASIFNHYGQYGSPYSTESACAEYATDPPVIVDQSGKYYGRLSLNRYHPELGYGASFTGWLAAVCRD